MAKEIEITPKSPNKTVLFDKSGKKALTIENCERKTTARSLTGQEVNIDALFDESGNIIGTGIRE